MVELAARIAVLTPALFSLLLFKREHSFPECLLVFAEPSIPPLILRDDATLHHPPRGLTKAGFVTQHRLRVAHVLDVHHRALDG